MSQVEHSTRKHALLSASGSSRWLKCTPSARLEEKFEESKQSIYAREGTLAHEFADIKLRHLNGEISEKILNKELLKLRKEELYTEEMEPEVQKYIDAVWEAFLVAKSRNPDAILLIEERFDFTHLVEKGFGTGDATIISDDLLDIWDLKYGKGIRVDAEDNSQLMLYGSGALRKFDLLYDIKKVRLNIGQPRLDHISSWELSTRKLETWGEKQVKPKALKAYAGEGRKSAGSWCRWCKVKAMCNTLAKHNIKLAQHEFKDPHLLTNLELTEIYKQQPMLVDWVNAVGRHLLSQALQGKKVPGYKVVEGRSNRKWSDDKAVQTILEQELYETQDFSDTKVKGIPAIEKLLGKHDFNALVVNYVVKPPGKATLVSESDSRPDYNLSSAQADFAD